MNLIISNQAISQHNGLYSLNDLHKASGGAKKHEPYQFMRNQETKELIAEIESEKQIAYETVIGKGKNQGTYVCKELVYRYAMWISPKFSLMVIRTFDDLVQQQMVQNYSLLDQYNKAVLEFEKLSDMASNAGRMLNLTGKQFKPKAKERVLELTLKIQPMLPFAGFLENGHA